MNQSNRATAGKAGNGKNTEAEEHYITWDLEDIRVGVALPGALYLYLDFRFITFRAETDEVDRIAYDRLEFKKIRNLFILEKDRKKFEEWAKEPKKEVAALEPENQDLISAYADVRRTLLDIFQSNHPNKVVTHAMESSKKIVAEVMKSPYTSKCISQLQVRARGTVDHSMNVSILASYLGIQMGYSHQIILQHLAMGGLLHDVGKTQIKVTDNDTKEVIEEKLLQHPALGVQFMEAQKLPNEVKLIIMQHHECFDGTGYPNGLRGNAIYDLTRIVSIANVFDKLVGEKANGTLVERQKAAIHELDRDLYRKFDPQKLEKALKILKLGV